ncbi:predicted hydrolase of the HAD superfamily [Candidatus Blochmanniella floridana]|uniref:Predicted hydrolase of the HAD superfamily n=1 Tax=Blochmanniella floridana TaxID=203907 RepID=Q7VRM6_BLOFL|nr:predicted hydrolase of the HAD superfamily [Candidatus Blochmannia floridanus]
MIYFHRKFKPFYAITLDLDNTLYNNYPVIDKVEKELRLFLRKYHPVLRNFKKEDYHIIREKIRLIDPDIYHNVNSWRWKSLERIFLQSGLSEHEATLGADNAMEFVLFWRNQINVSLKTDMALSALSSKWPLIAITNGNADSVLYNFKRYFSDILRAGIHGRAKPYTDMYDLASKYFEIPCRYILHIGDDLYTDVQGAMRSGMQSCWIKEYSLDMKNNNILMNPQLCPNLEISDLMSLTYLL